MNGSDANVPLCFYLDKNKHFCFILAQNNEEENHVASQSNLDLVNAWYDALAEASVEKFVAVHAPDVVYNISGHTPISGQIRGLQTLLDHVLPLVFGALDMSNFRFCKRHKIVCADSERVVGVMEADGPAVNGVRYDQRYVHIFAFRDGRISGVWEFFDTALANAAMFHGMSGPVPGVDAGTFDL